MTERLGQFVRTYWPVIAGLIAGVLTVGVAWGTSTAQLAAQSDQIAQMVSGQRRIEDKLDRIGTGLSSTTAALGFDERDLAEVHQRLQRLESRR